VLMWALNYLQLKIIFLGSCIGTTIPEIMQFCIKSSKNNHIFEYSPTNITNSLFLFETIKFIVVNCYSFRLYPYSSILLKLITSTNTCQILNVLSRSKACLILKTGQLLS
jgi:hypothetical protein